MDIQTTKLELIKLLIAVENESILQEIKSLLKTENNTVSEDIVAYTVQGEPLTKDQYIQSIDEIIEGIKNGEKTYSSQEILDHIFQKNEQI